MKSFKIHLGLFLYLILITQIGTAQVTKCQKPLYSIGWNNVSNPKKSDGSIIIKNISFATHYDVVTGNTPFDFNEATKIKSGQYTVRINGLANPTEDTQYFVRVYNGASCYRDDTINLSHIYFAKDRDEMALSVVQGADIASPQLNDVVTLTTLVQNKSTQDIENLELKQIISKSLDIIYFYADRGTYESSARSWIIGKLKGGEVLKLVIRVKVTQVGLSYMTSYVSRLNDMSLVYGQTIPNQDPYYKSMATTCVSVPIQIKNNQIYTISLKNYEGITWYYKDAAGNFSEITEYTNPAVAEINLDSSLSIKQGGEYTFTRRVGECSFSSCCPVIVESCSGPPIIVDSVYCNKNVDSYNIAVHLQNDNWSIVEKVYYAIANMSFPVLTNMLRRMNALPLTASSGFVTSKGNAHYLVENVPAFMPNVTLVSTDISGQCRTVKVVNAPNCEQALIPEPMLVENVQFYVPGQDMPNLRVANPQKGLKTMWFRDEVGINRISKGNTLVPDAPGKYYVAFFDKKTKSMSTLTEATIKDITESQPGQFVDVAVCDCENPSMLPSGKIGEIAVIKTYPNPVDDMLSVQYRVPSKSTKTELYFFNINGRRIASFDLSKDRSEYKVDVMKWVDGTYVYNLVVDGEKKASSKFIVRH